MESTIKIGTGVETGFLYNLNTIWHKRALQLFLLIVLAHWAEHLAQAVQIYILKWPRPQSNGVLGLFYPWLVTTEALHYGYAIVMLIGLFVLRKGFTGTSRMWWMRRRTRKTSCCGKCPCSAWREKSYATQSWR